MPSMEVVSNPPSSAMKRRRRKKKIKSSFEPRDPAPTSPEHEPVDVDIEYVPQDVPISELNETLASYFENVFAHFQGGPRSADEEAEQERASQEQDGEDAVQPPDASAEVDGAEEASDDDEVAPSNRKQRKLNRLTVAELKQLVEKPEVVEWVDVCASDPKLLVDIKSTRNTVPVPIHWSQKRKYLQNKRGLEKPPFELPDFIKATGILEMREALESKESEARLKQKTRERMQPKMGKLVIDYAKLHDAFFKWQTKPHLTIYGELYYEGREFETKLRSVRPGAPLSDALREALGMPPLAPPPWLVHMQRHGPPPSYPGLRIPGLNAPIPPGAQWGFHPGGWGKPPVDEYGRPLYGDVFANPFDPSAYGASGYNAGYPGSGITMEKWGEILPQEIEEEEEEEMEEEMSDEEDQMGEETGKEELITGDILVGSGQDQEEEEEMDMEMDENAPLITHLSKDQLEAEAAVEADLEAFVADLAGTGESLLRKPGEVVDEDMVGLETPSLATPAPPKELYTVLPERTASARGQFMGSDRLYDIRKVRPEEEDTPLPASMAQSKEEEPVKKKVRKEEKKRKDFKF